MAHQWSEVAESVQEELTKVAKEIVREGKGILAVDEFNEGAGELLASVGQENTAENRRKFREMLFTTPGLEKYVSGVILYDETVWQKTSTGIPFPEYLASRGIIPGVKADCDVVPLLGTDGEVTTQGLDDLLQRSKKYRKAGIRFAKWRCVLQIADNKPSPLSVNESAHVNARYAACSQQVSLFFFDTSVFDTFVFGTSVFDNNSGKWRFLSNNSVIKKLVSTGRSCASGRTRYTECWNS